MSSLSNDQEIALIARRVAFLNKNKGQRRTQDGMSEILKYFEKNIDDDIFTYFILNSFIVMGFRFDTISGIFNMIKYKIYHNLTYIFNIDRYSEDILLFSLTDIEKIYFIMFNYGGRASFDNLIDMKRDKLFSEHTTNKLFTFIECTSFQDLPSVEEEKDGKITINNMVIPCEQLMYMIEFLLVIQVKDVIPLIKLLIDTFPQYVCLLDIFKMIVSYDLPFACQFTQYMSKLEISRVLDILKNGSLKMIQFFIENLSLTNEQIVSLLQETMKNTRKNISWFTFGDFHYKELLIPAPNGLSNPFVCLGYENKEFYSIYKLKPNLLLMYDIDSKLMEENAVHYEQTECIIYDTIINDTSNLCKDLLSIVINYLFKKNPSGFELYLGNHMRYFQ